tara:strand:+ start:463 stop:855 length:393 start_codon:yes stop_codon:yes gene_type:complete
MFLKSKKIILILLVLVGLAFFSITVLFDDGVDQINFDSDVWKNTPAEFSLESTRLKMVDDFLDKYFIVGMFRDEVISLIGEPDQTEYFKSYEMVYMLGQETDSYFAIDSQWLVLDLNDSERVVSYNIVSD